jgi:hypothetical protein
MAEGVADAPRRSPDPAATRWRGERLQLTLAVLNVITVVASLRLSHRIMEIYNGSVRENQVWVTRMKELQGLRRHATLSNAAGNQVFVSLEPDTARNLVQESHREFVALNKSIRGELARQTSDDAIGSLRQNLDELELDESQMTNHCLRIFELMGLELQEDAAREAEAMNVQYRRMQQQLGFLMDKVWRLQESLFAGQVGSASQLTLLQRTISLMLVVVVGGVTFLVFDRLGGSPARNARSMRR